MGLSECGWEWNLQRNLRESWLWWCGAALMRDWVGGKADKQEAWLIHSFKLLHSVGFASEQTHDGKRRAGSHRPTPITIPPNSNEQQHAAGSVKSETPMRPQPRPCLFGIDYFPYNLETRGRKEDRRWVGYALCARGTAIRDALGSWVASA